MEDVGQAMINPDMIPDEAVEAAERTYRTVPLYTSHVDAIRAAIAAALAAWPGANVEDHAWAGYGGSILVLPLPQKEGDA
jgi:hypothetical protein